MYEQQLITYIVETKDYSVLKRNGLEAKHFSANSEVVDFIDKYHLKYKTTPSKDTLISHFDFFQFTEVEDSEEYLSNQVRETYLYTQLAPVLKQAAEKTRENSVDAIQYMKEHIDDLIRESNTKVGIGVDIISNAEDRFKEYQKRKSLDGLLGISSGVKQLDEILYGWAEEDLVTVVARPSEGKTWLLLYFAVQAWIQGKRVLFYSGEMSAHIIGFRVDALLAHFSNASLMRGDGKCEAEYFEYIDKISNKEGFVVVAPEMLGGTRPTTKDIFELADYHKPDIIVLDYIDLIDDWRKAKETRNRLGNISTELQNYSATEGIPILTAAQANRDAAKKNQDKEDPEPPQGHEISESDQVLQNSTRVLGMARVGNILKLAIRKNRYGISQGEVLLHWDIDRGKISPLLDDDKMMENDYGF